MKMYENGQEMRDEDKLCFGVEIREEEKDGYEAKFHFEDATTYTGARTQNNVPSTKNSAFGGTYPDIDSHS